MNWVEHYAIGAAVSGFTGTTHFLSSTSKSANFSCSGLTFKAQGGVPVHFSNFTLFPIYGGFALSKDFGSYPELRSEIANLTNPDDASTIASENALATTLTVGPQFVFYTTKDYGFSLNPIFMFNYGIDSEGWHKYAINGRIEAIVRLKKFYVRTSMTLLSKTYGWQISLLYGF